MASIQTYTFTPEELAENMNQAVAALAQEMLNDGLIASTEQVTDRYLVLIVRKGRLARMFDKLFTGDDQNATLIRVVRVDNSTKKTPQDV